MVAEVASSAARRLDTCARAGRPNACRTGRTEAHGIADAEDERAGQEPGFAWNLRYE